MASQRKAKHNNKRGAERAAPNSATAAKAKNAPPAPGANEAPVGSSGTVADNATGSPPVPFADNATGDPPANSTSGVNDGTSASGADNATDAAPTRDVDQDVDMEEEKQDTPATLLDLSGGIPWEDESLDLAERVSLFEGWWNARLQKQTEWKAQGKPKCDSCGKKHAQPCIPQDTFNGAVSLGKGLQKDFRARAAESSGEGAENAAQKETEENEADKAKGSKAEKAKDSQPKTVCNRVCTHCGNKHFFIKKFPNGCKVPPCPACGKGHSAGTCAELRKRFIERGIMISGAHLVANTSASHGNAMQPLEEVIERGAQIVSSAPAQYSHAMSALAQRAVQMAVDGAQTGHMTLPDRTKRSMNDDDDSDGGRPAGKKSKRTNPYGRR